MAAPRRFSNRRAPFASLASRAERRPPLAEQITMADLTHGWRQDFAYVTRSLTRSPGFAIAVVLMLALGLGANAAIFSFLDQVFLRAPAGVPSADQLRRVWSLKPHGRSNEVFTSHLLSYHEYRAVADALRGQAELALYTTQPDHRIGRGASTIAAAATYATASYFSALGAHPAMGRWFTDAEADVHGAANVVVIGDAFWRTNLGGDPHAVGTTITIDDREFTVIGIARAGFSGIDLQATDLWIPLGTFPTHEVGRVSFWDSSAIFFSVFGRVVAGANERVVEERATTALRFAPLTDFENNPKAQVLLRSIIDARGPGDTPKEVSIAVRLGVVALLILLITAANVVNLLLARSTSRRREVAVRLALGVSRARLMRLFVIESALLALVAGAAALLVTQLTGGVLRSLLLPGTHFANGPLRWQVVVTTALLSLITGAVAGIVPAVQGSKPELTSSLKAGARDGGTGRARLPGILVAAQAALSVVLLFGAAQFIESLLNVERLRIGFDVPRIAYASVTMPDGVRADTSAFAATMREAGDRVRAIPGVEAVGFARDEPMRGFFGRVLFYTASDSSEAPGRPLPTASYVSADFFKAIGASFTRGATFSDQDASSATAVIVNQTIARTYWPNQDPVGQCIRIQQQAAPCLLVAGVVEDAIRGQLLEDPAPQLYLPIFRSMRGQRPPTVMVVRADPVRLSLAMTQAARILHDEFPRGAPNVVPMSARLAPQYRPWELGAALFGVFGALALVVAALGIYSSVSYAVTERAHELGIRIALGADGRDVMRHVVGRGVLPVVTGALVGAALAFASGRLIGSLLYGVNPRSPALVGAVVVSLIAIGVVAAGLPGWRATRIDPVRAMLAD